MTEIMTAKYVIYRAYGGDLDYMTEETWDDWATPRSTTYRAKAVSRGHTLVEAINLIKFANKLENQE